MDTLVWKKRKVDKKGRTVLPIKLRKLLGIGDHSAILWIQVHRYNDKKNEFSIEVGVDNNFLRRHKKDE
jgi:bifunctional DNA-binding transcriptional regulator/antitoxin component of YhaV-PrlF toxin-antitoxin module